MPKLVRNSSATSRSGERSRPYARSVTLISAIALSSCVPTLDMLDHRHSQGKKREWLKAGGSLLAEVGLADPRVAREIRRRAFGDDAPLLEDVRPGGDRERLDDVLLDQQHRDAVGVDAGDDLEHLIDDLWREPERWLVEQQESRHGHQRPTDGDHLLLPAGERAGELSPALAQGRKGRVDPLEAPAAQPPRWRRVAADLQVLLDGHGRKEAAAFGDERDAVAAEVVRRYRRQIATVEADGSGPDRQEAGDRVDQCRLAGAVRSHHGDEVARADAERHVPDGDGVAVGHFEVLDLKHRPFRDTPARPPGRA